MTSMFVSPSIAWLVNLKFDLQSLSNPLTKTAICAVVIVGSSIFGVSHLAAQNPFGASGQATNRATPSTTNPLSLSAGEEILPFSSNPQQWNQSTRLAWEEIPRAYRSIIDSVRKSNPTTAIQLAKAMEKMLDINQVGEAHYYLKKLVSVGGDAAELFELYQAVGPEFFLRIHAEDGLQPEGATYAKSVSATVRRESYSPARVNSYIKNLNDPDIPFRSENFRRLRRLGAPAAARMIEVFADGSRQSEFPGIRTALKLMGEPATGPLLGALRSNVPFVQMEAVRGLTGLKTELSNDTLTRVYLTNSFPEPVRQLAGQELEKRFVSMPTPELAQPGLSRRARLYLMGKSSLGDSSENFTSLWFWNGKTNRLTETSVSRAVASRNVAAEIARDLYEISPNLAENRLLYLLTQLESAKRMAGPNQLVDAGNIRRRVAGLTTDEIDFAIGKAIELGLIPAAIAGCELLADVNDVNVLMGRRSNLINAIMDGNRHLQIAALDAIVKMDPKQPFPGSSYVLGCAVHLAKSRGQGSAVVADHQLTPAQSLTAVLSQSRIFGHATSTGKRAFEEATGDPDVEFLMISSTLTSPSYPELVYQLRNDWRTRKLPIAIMVRNQDAKLRAEKIFGNDQSIHILPLTMDEPLVGLQVQQLLERQQPWPVTRDHRSRHSEFAIKWLGRVASDRKAYGFYDLRTHEADLIGLIYKPGHVGPASRILAHLGTHDAQLALLDFIGQESVPVIARRAATKAFSDALQSSGTMLTLAEIRLQYERYNASENQPQESQELLGQVLDLIEGRGK